VPKLDIFFVSLSSTRGAHNNALNGALLFRAVNGLYGTAVRIAHAVWQEEQQPGAAGALEDQKFCRLAKKYPVKLLSPPLFF
jgi:hypothetical protein